MSVDPRPCAIQAGSFTEPVPGRNPTDCDYPLGRVHELIQKQAERVPWATALKMGEEHITYRQLNERANRLAHFLRSRGVDRGGRVCVSMEQSFDAIVGLLAVLKAGAAYVPLNPDWPRMRCEQIVHDCGASLVLTRRHLLDRIPADVGTVCLDRDSEAILAQDSSPPAADGSLDDPAYVLYTSGSTGKPKGVIGIHRSVVNGLLSVSYAVDERCCLDKPLTFGFSLANLFLPLMCGLRLVVMSLDQIKDLREFVKCLEDEAITRLVLLPPILKQILEIPQAAFRLRSIREIGLAGAALTPDLLRRCSEIIPQVRLHNSYSSTEIGTLATFWNVTPEAATNEEIVIGYPVANTRIYILDENRRPLPAGVTGEIYVGARHLARGYLNDPDLTAERFDKDPFRADEGQRIFRTGDLGRFRPDGAIEFRGRSDELVKIRGFRIELAEIEKNLANHPGVGACAVAARELAGDLRLVAYVVPDSPAPLKTRELRGFLASKLPDYLVPSMFVFLEQMPLGDNGKVDRAALPDPAPGNMATDEIYEAPRNGTENVISGIWCDVLGLHQPGINDHFLEVGGDSLAAVRIAGRIEERLGVIVRIEDIFELPTIALLSEHISISGASSLHLSAER